MKNKFMQMIVGTFLGVLVLACVAQILVFGQENRIDAQQSQTLVGVWQTTVTQRNCMTGDPIGPAFQGVSTYHEGGTAAEDAASSSPSLRSSGHGIWNASNQFHPTVAFTFLRYNADGTFAGRNIVRQTLTIGASGNDFTSTGTVEVFAANGTLIFAGCSTATATRFQ